MRAALDTDTFTVRQFGPREGQRVGVELEGRCQYVLELVDFDAPRRKINSGHVASFTVPAGRDAATLADSDEFGRHGRTEIVAGGPVDDRGRCQFDALAEKRVAAL